MNASIRTGFRPEPRGERWGLTHDKAPWRKSVAHIEFDSRDEAEQWIANHLERLRRGAAERERRRASRTGGRDA